MPSPRGLVQQVDQMLHQSKLIPRHARLLVAVSGGADSVALLRLLIAINGSDYWGWTLVMGHVEHGIRGEESLADARWVAELAKELGLICAQRSLGLDAGASEATARLERHNALRAMATEHGCAGIVFGHHADDQAETVLMRIFRGCGIDGLQAMSAKSQWTTPVGTFTLWHPLLQVRRTQLREYLAEIGQSWREDHTNASTKYARNRLRADVMPVVEELWPGAVEALGRLSRIACETNRVMEVADEEFRRKANISLEDSVFPRKVLRDALPALVANLLRDTVAVQSGGGNAGGGGEINDFDRISESIRLIQGTHGAKEIELGSNAVVEIEGELVRVIFRKPKPRDA